VPTLDAHLNGVAIEQQRSVALGIDWAPAYELVLSLSTFLHFGRGHSLLDVGPAWAAEVRAQLPHDLMQRLSRKPVAKAFKEYEVDRLMLLVEAAPGPRDASTFVSWLGDLTAGGAYECLAPRAPEPGPQLPRDFMEWRDSISDVLAGWNDSYFHALNPAILVGLEQMAATLRARLPNADPIELVDEVTNGLLIEASDAMRHVVLVPQYHNRPYNDSVEIRDGTMIMFPCDVLPPDPLRPSPRLMRLTHALSDESRLRMLRFLRRGPCSLTEVARYVGLSQPTVHHHLTQLRAAGLVQVHVVDACPSRYSLRPYALEQLSTQLGNYLLSDPEDDAS
jgi:DNA-binding transcriptional ArsR family regulator